MEKGRASIDNSTIKYEKSFEEKKKGNSSDKFVGKRRDKIEERDRDRRREDRREIKLCRSSEVEYGAAGQSDNQQFAELATSVKATTNNFRNWFAIHELGFFPKN